MPRMRILSTVVQELFETPPVFNSVQREYKDWCYIRRKERDQTLSSLLSRLDDDIFGGLKNIRDLTEDASLSGADKVVHIRALLIAQDDSTPRAEDQLASLKRGLEGELGVDHYYEVLEDRSIRPQNRVSPIIKALSLPLSSSRRQSPPTSSGGLIHTPSSTICAKL